MLDEADGVIVSQEESGKFVHLSGAELAAKVARSLSPLARRLGDHVENGYNAARADRTSFNAKYQLTATAKRAETIDRRIAAIHISNTAQRDALAGNYLSLLARLSGPQSEKAQKLIAEWSIYENPEETLRNEIDGMLRFGKNKTELARSLSSVFQRYADTNRDTEATLNELDRWRDALGKELQDFQNHHSAWSEWLAHQTGNSIGDDTASPDTLDLQRQLEELLQKRKGIEKAEKELKARLDHLSQTAAYLRTHWEPEHPNTCPTCDSKLQDGITNVVERLTTEAEEQAVERHRELDRLSSEIQQAEARIKAAGALQCPVPEPTRKRMGLPARRGYILTSPDSP